MTARSNCDSKNLLSIPPTVLLALLLGIFCSLLLPSAGQAADVMHSGPLAEDETWSASDEHYVMGDVTVPEDTTLTIEAGSHVFFEVFDDQESGGDPNKAELVVNGSLVAVGTESAPIAFTSSAATPAKGDWYGIRVSGSDLVHLEHCVLEYASQGLSYARSGSVGQGVVTVRNCEIRHTGGTGLYVVGSGSSQMDVEVIGNRIEDHGAYGVHLRAETGAVLDVDVRDNEVSGTGSYGLRLESYRQGARLQGPVTGNEVYGCRKGMYLNSEDAYNYYHANTDVGVEQNLVHHNTEEGIYVRTRGNYAQLPGGIGYNRVYENGTDGIAFSGGASNRQLTPFIYGNEVYGNGDRGVECNGGNNILPTLHYNKIYDNGGYGVYLYVGGVVEMNHNDLYGNANYGVYNATGFSVDGRHNWWGVGTTEEMAAGGNPKNVGAVYDIYDNTGVGVVTYVPWLTTAVHGEEVSTEAVSRIIEPASGSTLQGSTQTVSGMSTALAGIDRVEVSLDGGQSWQEATGTRSWSYEWTLPGEGSFVLQSRVITQDAVIEVPTEAVSVTVDQNLPTTTGSLEEDETWEGRVNLTGDVVVPEGVTLTLEPGTQLVFPALNDDTAGGNNTSRTELVVNGSLVAVGTESSPIAFTSSAATPARGDWYGIRVSGSDLVHLEHCVLEYASQGLSYARSGSVGQGVVTVRNCEIRHTGGTGLYVVGSGSSQMDVEVIGNRIEDHGAYGVHLRAETGAVLDVDVRDNEVSGTGSYGLRLESYRQGARLQGPVTGNEVYGCRKGMYLNSEDAYNYYHANTDVGVEQNLVHHNSEEGIYVRTRGNYAQLPGGIGYNRVYENGTDGITISGGASNRQLTPFIYGNEVYGNGDRGVECNGGNNILPTLHYNKIYNNGGYGVYLQVGGVVEMNHNDLYGNGNYGVYNATGFSVDGRNNWWGVGTTEEMAAGGNPKNVSAVYDIYDNSGVGAVIYAPWLTTAVHGEEVSTEAVSRIIEPASGSALQGSTHTVSGMSTALAGIDRVEVSLDGGQSWQEATGTRSWSYEWTLPGEGSFVLQSRVITQDAVIEVPTEAVSVTVDQNLPTTTGTLEEDETWEGRVNLTGDVVVPEGVTLTLEPGTQLVFPALNDDTAGGNNTSRTELVVNGSLVAVGTESSPIAFTSSAATPARGDWYGIRVSGSDLVHLEHCVLEYASQGLSYARSGSVGQGVVTVRNCEIRHTGGTGLYVVGSGSSQMDVEVIGNRIEDHGAYGVHLRAETGAVLDVDVRDNEVSGTGSYGLRLESYRQGARLQGPVTGNEVYGCRKGMYLNSEDAYNYYHANTDVGVEQNLVHHNSEEGIYVRTRGNYAQLPGGIGYNRVYENGTDGIAFSGGASNRQLTPFIYGNEVYGNGDRGVECNGGNNILPTLHYNKIYDNGGYGVYLYVGGVVEMNHNDLYGNANYGVYNATGFSVDGRHNWWGVGTTEEMAAGGNPKNVGAVYDIYDNTGVGVVTYVPWLTTAVHGEEVSTEAVSRIIEPASGSALQGSTQTVSGMSTALAGIDRVEVSLDGGQSWQEATGTRSWSYEWTLPGEGSFVLQSRVITQDAVIEVPTEAVSVTVDQNLPTTTGSLEEDETWEGRVNLTGDVVVPEGVTLTLEPGTQLVFPALNDDTAGGNNTSRTELVVNGSLVAVGTESSPIAFTSSAATPARGDWYGIRVSGSDLVHLEHCVLEYASQGLSYARSGSVGQGVVTVRNCEIRHTGGTGLYVVGSGSSQMDVEVIGNRIEDHGAYGVHLRAETGAVLDVDVRDNEVSGTGSYGLRLESYRQGARLQGPVTGNEVYGCRKGMYLNSEDAYNYYHANTDVGVEQNLVHHNSEEGIYVRTRGNYAQLPGGIGYNRVYENGTDGITISGGASNRQLTPFIYGNEVYGNGDRGVECNGGNNILPTLHYNKIYNNGGYGVYLQVGGVVEMNHNDLYGNGNYGVYNATGFSVDGRNNWWGVGTTEEMAAGGNPKNVSAVYDIYDNSGVGAVIYAPWLTTAVHGEEVSTEAVSRIIEPASGSALQGSTHTVSGMSTALAGIDRVEVSLDGGQSWQEATGTRSWSYEWTLPGEGSFVLQSRVITQDAVIEVPTEAVSVTVDQNLPTTTGTLEEDETWEGRVNLTGDVVVPEGVTLTLEPGTQLVFPALNDDTAGGNNTSRTELVVNGSLVAVGTESSPIAFTSSAATPARGDWYGIRVSGSDLVHLEHCVLEYASQGLSYARSGSVGQGVVTVRNCEIRHTGGTGLYVVGSGSSQMDVEVIGNRIEDHGAYGVHLRAETGAVLDVDVRDNEVSGTGSYGLRLESYRQGARLQGPVTGNEVYGCRKGMYLNSEDAYNYYHANTDVGVEQNLVHHNTEEGIYVRTRGNYAQLPGGIGYNRVYENGTDGIAFSGGASNRQLTPFIYGNEVYGNGDRGVECNGGNNILPTLHYNKIYDNGGYGVYLYVGGVVEMNHNDLYGNANYGVYNATGFSVDGRHNWWGVGTTEEMAAGGNPKNVGAVYDIYDNTGVGVVTYVPWLTTAVHGEEVSTEAVSRIIEPASGSTLQGSTQTVSGMSTALAGIDRVEVSLDGGQSWQEATGTRSWSYEWTLPGEGSFVLQSRVITQDAVIEVPTEAVSVTVDQNLPTTTGSLEEDETWEGRVNLTGDVVVPEGVTLTLEPGTQLVFPALNDDTAGGNNTSRTELVVNGSLVAVGTESAPIVFTSSAATPARGDWYGIRVSGSDLVHLEHCVLEYASQGLSYVRSGSVGQGVVTVRNCDIRHTDGTGLYVVGSGSAQVDVEVSGNRVVDHGADGVHLRAETGAVLDVDVRDNDVSGAGSYGLRLESHRQGARLQGPVTGNEVYGCRKGMYLNSEDAYNYYHANTDVGVEQNLVHHNTEEGIYVRTRGTYAQLPGGIGYNRVYENGTDGITISGGASNRQLTPFIYGNEVYGNGDRGVECVGGDRILPTLHYNKIYNNGGVGVYLQVGGVVEMNYNDLYGNYNYDISLASAYEVDATSNWWGVDVTNTLNVGSHPANLLNIYDSNDNASYGTVDYSDWLNMHDQPEAPGLDTVLSPTSADTQYLTGTKAAGTAIVLNGTEIVPLDDETTWSYELALQEGHNPLSIHSVSEQGMISDVVDALIVLDTQAPRVISSVPANGSYVTSHIQKCEVQLYDDATAVDYNGTLQDARLLDSQGMDVSGTWSAGPSRVIFEADAVLPDDAYTITLDPTDEPLGNSATVSIGFMVDTSAPDVLHVNSTESPTRSVTQTISGEKDADTSIWINATESVALNADETWQTTVSLQEGANIFNIVSRDEAGNTSEAATVEIVLDTVAPAVTDTVPAEGSFTNQRPAGVAIVFEEVTTSLDTEAMLLSAQVADGGDFTVAGSWAFEAGNRLVFTPEMALEEDTYSVTVTPVDVVGNTAATAFSFTYDATPPAAPGLDPVTSPANNARQTLTGTKEAETSVLLNGNEIVSADEFETWSAEIELAEGTNDLVIYAMDRAGNASDTVSATIIFDDVSPLPVSNLVLDGRGDGSSVLLDWSGYDEGLHGDVHHYRIFSSESLFTQTAEMPSTGTVPAGTFTYTVGNLTKGQLYYFAVVAVDTNGNANTSVTPVSKRPADSVAPGDPSGIAVSCGQTSLTFTWEASSIGMDDLSGFRVYFDGATEAEEVSADEPAFEATGLSPSSTYSIRVTALDQDGNESEGAVTDGSTLVPDPVVTGVTPYSGMIGVTWMPVEPAEMVRHYAVYVSENDPPDLEGLEPTVTTTASSAKVAGLTNGTTYFVAVSSVNLSGCQNAEVTSSSTTPVEDAVGPEIRNATIDTVPLTDGLAVSQAATISVEAQDPAGVAHVDFLVDGDQRGTDTNGADQYTFIWDVKADADGQHTLDIVAWDTFGNGTTEQYTLTVALATPAAPTLLSPAAGTLFNRALVTVAGQAETGTEVMVYSNETEAATWTAVDRSGLFNISTTLFEGSNRLRAAARNRTGTGALSQAVSVTLDSTIPNSPSSLAAETRPAGIIRLSWQRPLEGSLDGYYLYRAPERFSSVGEAVRLNSAPLKSNAFDDLTPEDGTWYYRVSTRDLAGNESALSEYAFATSDRTAPRAEAISYAPTGSFDPQTGRMAPGTVNVTLSVSEPLQAQPFLSITPEGGAPISVQLIQGAGQQQYSGFFVITETTPTGTAYAVFSGRDRAGNRGTEIVSGQSLLIDTDGPAVKDISIVPADPIRNAEEEPTEVTVEIGLTEAVGDGTVPELAYLLSGEGRSAVSIEPLNEVEPRDGQAQAWQATFALDSDAGLSDVETLAFAFSASDDLGNEGTQILCDNQFQIYQGDLPPLDTPSALHGKSLPGGRIELSWAEVEDAAGYELFRKAPGEDELTLYQTLDKVHEYTDQPQEDGTYTYALTSLRDVNGEVAASALCTPVEVASDAVSPGTPTNLALELEANGVLATWDPPPYTEPVTYAIYRAETTEIPSVEGLTAIRDGINDAWALDSQPSATEHAYVVTAVDKAGNESLPSNTFYLNIDLLPVSSLSVLHEEGQLPEISWTHSGGSISGFNIYLGDEGEETKLNPSLLPNGSYTDTGYSDELRRYSVTAVDGNDTESLARAAVLPQIRAELAENTRLERGLMNRLEYVVRNRSATKVDFVRLLVAVAGRTHVSESFSIDANTEQIVAVVVGGYADLQDRETLSTTIEIAPDEGTSIQITRETEVPVSKGMLLLSILNDPFVRGGNGQVRFTLENTSDTEIEIITARQAGTSASDEIVFTLVDEDDNVLATQAVRQALGEKVVTLAGGTTVARVPAGEAFTSDAVELNVPASTPDELTVRLDIAKLHYHLGGEDAVSMDGLGTTYDVSLIETSYYGEVLEVAPGTSNGDQDIVITGRAVERATGQALADVPLKLVIVLDGFERSVTVYSDDDGTFSYTFVPLATEAGIYTVRALHPDRTDRPVQAQFVINRIGIAPNMIDLSMPRNYERTLNIRVTAGPGTTATNLALAYEALDQPEGAFPQGVYVELGDAVSTLEAGQGAELALTLWADNSAADSGKLVFKVKSDETGTGSWGSVVVDTQFSEARPVLDVSPTHIETGVDYGDVMTETVILANKGLADMTDVSLALVLDRESGLEAPVWVFLNGNQTPGSLAVGDSLEMSVSFAPDTSVDEGVYTFYLRVAAANHATVDIPLYCTVTQAGVGGALFKVTDTYTGTQDENGNVIQGLSGARIELQHELVSTIQASATTDSMGEAQLVDLDVGRYRYRISAGDHYEKRGRIWIKPGVTSTEQVYLSNELVTVEWAVTETAVDDQYEIVLKSSFETDVPTAVVVAEPASVQLPEMVDGDVYYGEFTLTNYGLAEARELQAALPEASEHFQYELLTALPDVLAAKERITVPYRVVCVKSPLQGADGQDSGAGCEIRRLCWSITYLAKCMDLSKGDTWIDPTERTAVFCFLYPTPDCISGLGLDWLGDITRYFVDEAFDWLDGILPPAPPAASTSPTDQWSHLLALQDSPRGVGG